MKYRIFSQKEIADKRYDPKSEDDFENNKN